MFDLSIKKKKKSSKKEPVKQTGEYLEITVPDKV
jgi:hypothetical protein